jgi:competence protein ComEC
MLERVSLFKNSKETLIFLLLLLFIFISSLSIQYHKYKELTKFDSALINARVIKQYTKTKKIKNSYTRTYQVLKLKSDDGVVFYTIAKKDLKDIKNKDIKLEVWCGDITFYEYLRSFFAYSKILEVSNANNIKHSLNTAIENSHTNKDISSIYKALYTASPLPYHIQKQLSELGVSHLIAISGFHLGVLSSILYFLLKYPYRLLQNRYFPYRSYTRDSFFIISSILFLYLLFLDAPPSLIRAFGMFVIVYIFYERWIKIISMQTLFVTLCIIIAFLPKLIFSIGFWLSVSGVFYIFLFLTYFKNLHKIWQFLLLPIWVYLMMLPYSLSLFHNFGIYHPLSIIWTSLFSIFYPLSILLHILNIGQTLDFVLLWLLNLSSNANNIEFWDIFLYVEILLSAYSIYNNKAIKFLLIWVSMIFVYMVWSVV